METILYSAVAGGIYAFVGYFKNKRREEYFEGFDLGGFLSTVVGSAVIGGISAYAGVAPDAIASSAIGVAVYQTLRKLFKSVIA